MSEISKSHSGAYPIDPKKYHDGWERIWGDKNKKNAKETAKNSGEEVADDGGGEL